MEQKEVFWHALAVDGVAKELSANLSEGLKETEVKERRRIFGFNTLPEEKPKSQFRIFLDQFKSPLIYILAIAGSVTLFLRDFTDSIVIFGAVFLNVAIGFFQERKTSKILAELKKIIKEKAHVIRGGNEKEIDASDLVPGDIFVLEAGSRAPTDGRLIESYSLKINEAALTGEWLPKETLTDKLAKDTVLADRDNMVYMGTIIEEGKGIAVAVATASQTEIGKIAQLVKEAKEEKTPYQKKIVRFSQLIAVVILLFSALIFAGGIIAGKEFLEMFTVSVAMAVAAIPEGLPVAVTVIFTFGMREILRKKGLVRNLLAAETLGSTSIICTDKTGTLTEAKMQVAGIFTGTRELLSDGNIYAEKVDQNGLESHITVLKIAALCSDAYIENPEDEIHRWVMKGRPMDKALLLAGMQAGLSKKELEKIYPRHDELPFDPSYKYSAGLHHLNDNEDVIYIIGAPEKILAMSRFIELDGKQEIFNDKKSAELIHKLESLTEKALRVVAVGYKKIKKGALLHQLKLVRDGQPNIQQKEIKNHKQKIYEEHLTNLIFVGFIALKDPLRKDAKEAIQLCRKAGMRPIIVTGDHKLTARAIAKELDLPAEEKNIIEGWALADMSDEELKERVSDFEIYARVEPAQKLKIIEAWQAKGGVVAMTGDGVNDAPALKKANIGLALGSGTEVAKEASDLVLLNDSFYTIVTAVEEGRRIIDNIRKIITYLLSGGFTEIMLIGLAMLFGLPLPVLAGQILWKNLIESTPPAMALAFEPKEKDVMSRPPEDPKISLLNSEMKALIFIIGTVTNLILFGLFLWLLNRNFPIEEIRSIMFVGLAIDSFFIIFSCRNLRKNIWQFNPFSNLYIVATITVGFLGLLAALYLSVFQALLKTVPLGLFAWLILLGFALLNLFLVEITKWRYIKKHAV
ncbi:MAG: HAD-IC family P-type ATPase [Candidatus Tagabacteria bacterium]